MGIGVFKNLPGEYNEQVRLRTIDLEYWCSMYHRPWKFFKHRFWGLTPRMSADSIGLGTGRLKISVFFIMVPGDVDVASLGTTL